MWLTSTNSSTNSTNSAHTARRPYGTTSIGFAPPNRTLRFAHIVHVCPLMFAPHCLSTKRQADIVASLGTHMNSGNPIEVVPLRATTGLCGGAIHSATVPLSRTRTRANISQRRNRLRSIFDFSLFALFRFSRFPDFDFSGFSNLFALYNADRATLLVAGDDPCERAPATIRRGERSVT